MLAVLPSGLGQGEPITRRRELDRMLAQTKKLTSNQRRELLSALSQPDGSAQVAQLLESRPAACPHCGDASAVRHGHASGLQRYRCRGCAKTFNALTATPLARLRHKDKWERQAAVLRQGLSVHQAVGALGVALSTAFRWRLRFLQRAQGVEAQTLQGVVEADETYFLRSNKGQRVHARKARHRGGSVAKEACPTSKSQCWWRVTVAAPRQTSFWSTPTRRRPWLRWRLCSPLMSCCAPTVVARSAQRPVTWA